MRIFFLLFKQKTAYEMRISDWSSDGCSSDLFGAARRRFYRSLLLIGGNRELQRIFPAIGIHIIHAQYPSTRLQGIRLADYQAIARAVAAGAPDAAEAAAVAHVETVRGIVRELASAMDV